MSQGDLVPPFDALIQRPESRLTLPAPFLPENPHKTVMAADVDLRDERLASYPRIEPAITVHRREYYALIEHMNTQIGRILAALEASGKADNTWIFFTADHGLAVGHHGLLGKQNQYDHSVRVPFLVVGPQVPVGERRDQPIYLQDVMATALGLAGAQRPAHVFFHDVRPLIADASALSPYPSIYGSYLDTQRAITHDGWKLIVHPAGPVELLLHVAEDPLEEHDLASDPAQAARIADLRTRLAAVGASLDDPLPGAGTAALI